MSLIDDDDITLQLDAESVPGGLLEQQRVRQGNDLGSGDRGPRRVVRAHLRLFAELEEILDIRHGRKDTVAELVRPR